MMDQSSLLRWGPVRDHRMVHVLRGEVFNLISIRDQRLIVLLQAAKHQLHVRIRQIALLHPPLRVIHYHLDAVLDRLKALV